ncbi:hypothetical protein OSTOST_15710, partial [Ostertagia ostertagi]
MTQKIEDGDQKNAPFSRLQSTLGTVGWPITQASMSVLLGISSLAFVDSYVVQTCFKTVLLVITFGTIHALVFLPLVLMYSHKAYLCLADLSRRRRSPTQIHPRKQL